MRSNKLILLAIYLIISLGIAMPAWAAKVPADPAMVSYQKGVSYLKSNRLNKASAEFSKFLDVEPKTPAKPEMYLVAWASLAATFKEYQSYRAIDKIDETKIKRQELLCAYYLIMGKRKLFNADLLEASTNADKALKVKNKNCSDSYVLAHLLKSEILSKEGNGDAADAETELALGKNKNGLSMAIFAERLVRRLGVPVKKMSASLKMPSLMNKKFKTPQAYWVEVIRMNPDNISLYLEAAIYFKQAGDKQTAIKYYSDAMKIDSENPHLLNSLGFFYYEKYNDEDAVDKTLLDTAEYYLNRAIVEDPYYNHSYNTLGVIYKERGDYETALKNFTQAIEIGNKYNTEYAKPYGNLGDVYMAQEKYDLAEENIRKALELESEYWPAQRSLGDLYFEKKNYVKALEMYKKAHQNYRSVYNFYQIFKTQIALQNAAEAIKIAQEEAKNDPENAGYYNTMIDDYQKTATSSVSL